MKVKTFFDVCYLFFLLVTARNEVGARSYFLKRVSRILSTGGGEGGLQTHTQGGGWGSGWGGLQAHTRGEMYPSV